MPKQATPKPKDHRTTVGISGRHHNLLRRLAVADKRSVGRQMEELIERAFEMRRSGSSDSN